MYKVSLADPSLPVDNRGSRQIVQSLHYIRAAVAACPAGEYYIYDVVMGHAHGKPLEGRCGGNDI